MPIIEVNHVTKEYRLGYMKSLKQTALNTLNRFCGKSKQKPAHARVKSGLDPFSFPDENDGIKSAFGGKDE